MPEELVSVKIWTATPSLVLPKSPFEILVAAWMVVAPATSRTTATDDSANISVLPPGESHCITKRCRAVAQGLFQRGGAEERRRPRIGKFCSASAGGIAAIGKMRHANRPGTGLKRAARQGTPTWRFLWLCSGA